MNKAKHAFGSSTGVEVALQNGKIDAYDILFLDGDTEPKIGWIDKGGTFRLVKNESTDLSGIEAELKTKANAEEVTELSNQIAKKVDADTVQTMIEEHSESAIEVVEF